MIDERISSVFGISSCVIRPVSTPLRSVTKQHAVCSFISSAEFSNV